MEKAYKLLAIQLGISNSKAKELIDKGLVSANGKRIRIARTDFASSTRFSITNIAKPEVIFRDENLLALEKPAFIESYDLLSTFKNEGLALLHRLDKETSGVILLVQENSDFHIRAKRAFKEEQVYKEYVAIVGGMVAESMDITYPIDTIKGNFARSRVSKNGARALTHIEPLQISGKKTMLKVIIKSGITHQIRVHLAYMGFPIIGDEFYGGSNAARIMLHAKKIKIFDYEIESNNMPFSL